MLIVEEKKFLNDVARRIDDMLGRSEMLSDLVKDLRDTLRTMEIKFVEAKRELVEAKKRYDPDWVKQDPRYVALRQRLKHAEMDARMLRQALKDATSRQQLFTPGCATDLYVIPPALAVNIGRLIRKPIIEYFDEEE